MMRPAWRQVQHRLRRHLWGVWALATVVALAAALLSGWAWLQAHRALWSAQAAQTAQAAASDQALAAAPPAPPPQPADFTQRLPLQPDGPAWLAELRRSSEAQGVRLGSIQLVPHAARTDELARLDVTLGLQGSYPALKQVLADVLARHPNTTLQRWTLQQPTPAAAVEATAVLRVWAQAAAGGASLRGRAP